MTDDVCGEARFFLWHIEWVHTGTAGVLQHTVEADMGRVVEEDGEGCGNRLDSNEDIDEFDEEGEESVVDVVVVVPEGDTPEEGGHEAEEGEDAPCAGHAEAEGAGVGEVEGSRTSLRAVEDGGKASGVIVKERLKVIEENLLLADACEIL